ncbi:MAG: FKBP-type peptidyl-prolyl cis-trans isomerase [Balneolaceae bacterium]
MKLVTTSLVALFLFSACSLSTDSNDLQNPCNSATLQAEQTFLEENAQNESITVTDSGLQYRFIEQTEDGASPNANSTVRVNYHGTLLSGDVFDSTRNRGPATFGLQNVIAGFGEGITLMTTGDVIEIFIPTNLAYGNNPPPGSIICPGGMLIFEIELLEIL